MSDEQEWEIEEVEQSGSLGAVISVRFPASLANRIWDEAKRQGVPTSTWVRRAVEEHLDQPAGAGAANAELTISGLGVSVSLYPGRRTKAQTQSAPLIDLVTSNA